MNIYHFGNIATNLLGARPVCFLKKRVKFDNSENPNLKAVSDISPPVNRSSFFASWASLFFIKTEADVFRYFFSKMFNRVMLIFNSLAYSLTVCLFAIWLSISFRNFMQVELGIKKSFDKEWKSEYWSFSFIRK